jgi:hypothetical protein
MNITTQIEVSDESLFDVSPYDSLTVDGNLYTYKIIHDPKTITEVKVKLISGLVVIKKIIVDDVQIHWLDKFGVYYDLNNHRIMGRYGYMNIAGTYTFKIRYSAKSFQYMLHLIDKFQI